MGIIKDLMKGAPLFVNGGVVGGDEDRRQCLLKDVTGHVSERVSLIKLYFAELNASQQDEFRRTGDVVGFVPKS